MGLKTCLNRCKIPNIAKCSIRIAGIFSFAINVKCFTTYHHEVWFYRDGEANHLLKTKGYMQYKLHHHGYLFFSVKVQNLKLLPKVIAILFFSHIIQLLLETL